MHKLPSNFIEELESVGVLQFFDEHYYHLSYTKYLGNSVINREAINPCKLAASICIHVIKTC